MSKSCTIFYCFHLWQLLLNSSTHYLRMLCYFLFFRASIAYTERLKSRKLHDFPSYFPQLFFFIIAVSFGAAVSSFWLALSFDDDYFSSHAFALHTFGDFALKLESLSLVLRVNERYRRWFSREFFKTWSISISTMVPDFKLLFASLDWLASLTVK